MTAVFTWSASLTDDLFVRMFLIELSAAGAEIPLTQGAVIGVR